MKIYDLLEQVRARVTNNIYLYKLFRFQRQIISTQQPRKKHTVQERQWQEPDKNLKTKKYF